MQHKSQPVHVSDPNLQAADMQTLIWNTHPTRIHKCSQICAGSFFLSVWTFLMKKVKAFNAL